MAGLNHGGERAWPWYLLLAVLGPLAALALGAALGLPHLGGPDPALWILAAHDLRQGLEPVVPPLYPTLVGVGAALSGAEAPTVAGVISVLARAPAGPLTMALARSLGAGRPVAMGAGLLVALHPDLVVTGLWLGPDTLTAALLLACALALVTWWRSPALLPSIALCLSVALLVLTRENGYPAALAAVLLVGFKRGAPDLRLYRATGLALVVLLAPLLVGGPPRLPWEIPWMERLVMPARDVLEAVPRALADRHPMLGESMNRLLMEGSPWVHPMAFLDMCLRGPGLVAAIFLGLLASLSRRRSTGWLPAALMVTALPALVFPAQPRHLAMYVPLAAAAVAAGLPGRARVPLVLLGLIAILGLDRGAAGSLGPQARSVAMHGEWGRALCSWLEPGAVAWADDPDFLLSCPLPRAAPWIPRAARWKVVWFTNRPPDLEDWGATRPPGSSAVVYRYMPHVPPEERPCSGSTLTPALPWAAGLKPDDWQDLLPRCEPDLPLAESPAAGQQEAGGDEGDEAREGGGEPPAHPASSITGER